MPPRVPLTATPASLSKYRLNATNFHTTPIARLLLYVVNMRLLLMDSKLYEIES